MTGGGGRRPVIGVTGLPGSGKSSVARMLRELGAEVISLDELGHEALEEEAVRREVLDAFPDAAERGRVSRAKLARVVFAEPAALARLEGILHPRMVRRAEEEVASWRERGPGAGRALAIEGALLVEMDLARLCDRVVLVTAPRDARAARVALARGWGEEDLARREKRQLADGERRRPASAVVDNAGDVAGLERRVRALWEEWT